MKRIPVYLLVLLAACFLNLPAHAQSITWNTDQMISVEMERTRTPADIAVSGDRAVAVWVQDVGGFDRVFASYSTNRGETWSAAQMIENQITRARNPRVVMSGSKVAVVWEQIPGSLDYKIYANYSTDGGVTWQATASPLLISASTGGDAFQTSVAISGDQVVVVWVQSPDGSYERVYANRSTNGGAAWSGPTQISNLNSAGAELPQVAISGSNVVALWLHDDSVSGYKRVRANYSTNGGGTWGTDAYIENLNAEDRYRPQVEISGNNVVAVWDTWDGSYSHIHANRAAFSGGALVWNPANVQLLEDTATGYYDYSPKIAISGNNVVVIWQRWNAGNDAWLQTVRSANAGANWSSPATIDSNIGGDGLDQQQLIMTDRYAVAIWQQVGSLAKIRVSSSFDKGETWTDPEEIDSSTEYSNTDPRIAASGSVILTAYGRYNYDIERVNIYVNSAAYASGGVGPIPGAGGGGGCFIASMAFGSPLAYQVDSLRKFRDGYLLTNSLGRKFVAWYYANGPAAAQFIADKPIAKSFVRAALYPLVGFSFLLVNGYLPFALAGLLLAAIAFLYLRRRKTAV